MDEKKTSLVEKITLTSVPADQRKSWPSIAFIWAGSVICIPALLVGSLISAGMNFKQSALCMVIGYVLVVFYMCLDGHSKLRSWSARHCGNLKSLRQTRARRSSSRWSSPCA